MERGKDPLQNCTRAQATREDPGVKTPSGGQGSALDPIIRLGGTRVKDHVFGLIILALGNKTDVAGYSRRILPHQLNNLIYLFVEFGMSLKLPPHKKRL
jgi:hypothetical protein